MVYYEGGRMTATHTLYTWTLESELSAYNMNHLESQWTVLTAELVAHNHNLVYYGKVDSDVKFFSVDFYEGFDADMLDGLHYSDLIKSVLPVGSILIWTKDTDEIPDGWEICNGAGITRDLRDRVVIGAGHLYAVGATGGSYSYTLSGVLNGTGDTILTTEQFPAHTHPYLDKHENLDHACGSGSTSMKPPSSSHEATGNNAGGGGAHNHDQAVLITTQGGNKDLKFLHTPGGENGKLVTVEYKAGVYNLTVTTTHIVVTIGTKTALQLVTLLNADAGVIALDVVVSLAPGSTGAGVPSAMATTNLVANTISFDEDGYSSRSKQIVFYYIQKVE